MIKRLQSEFDKILQTQFEKELAKASLDQLKEANNKLRLNNFAYSIRELSRHILVRLAPDEQVRQSPWFSIADKNKPDMITRQQRMKFAIQRSLSDEYVEDVLGLDLSETIKDLKNSIDILSKYTHVNQDTFNCNPSEVDAISNEVAKSFIDFFDEITQCREMIVNLLEDSINEELVKKLFGETINEIDCLATHHEIEKYSISSIKLTGFQQDSCIFAVDGDISVRLQYGSDGDMKRGDGYEFSKGFPYEATLTTSLVDAKVEYDLTVDNLEVNTDNFYK